MIDPRVEEHGVVSVLSLSQNIDLVTVEDIVTEHIVAHSETQETELDEETCSGHCQKENRY